MSVENEDIYSFTQGGEKSSLEMVGHKLPRHRNISPEDRKSFNRCLKNGDYLNCALFFEAMEEYNREVYKNIAAREKWEKEFHDIDAETWEEPSMPAELYYARESVLIPEKILKKAKKDIKHFAGEDFFEKLAEARRKVKEEEYREARYISEEPHRRFMNEIFPGWGEEDR